MSEETYYQKNREACKEYQRNRYRMNPERQKAYEKENKEMIRARKKAWYQKNKEIISARRKALYQKRKAEGCYQKHKISSKIKRNDGIDWRKEFEVFNPSNKIRKPLVCKNRENCA